MNDILNSQILEGEQMYVLPKLYDVIFAVEILSYTQ